MPSPLLAGPYNLDFHPPKQQTCRTPTDWTSSTARTVFPPRALPVGMSSTMTPHMASTPPFIHRNARLNICSHRGLQSFEAPSRGQEPHDHRAAPQTQRNAGKITASTPMLDLLMPRFKPSYAQDLGTGEVRSSSVFSLLTAHVSQCM